MIVALQTRKIVRSLFVSTIFFLISIIIDVDCLVASAIMSLALFIGLQYIYDRNVSFFSLRNLFYAMFYLFGMFLRYLVVIFDKKEFCSFVNGGVYMDQGYMIYTSVVVLLTSILFSIVLNIKKKEYYKDSHSENVVDFEPPHNLKGFNLVFLVLFVFVYAYKFSNMNLAVNFEASGSFDFLTTILRYLICLIAYMNLVVYYKWNKSTSLIIYIMFLAADIPLSLIQAWKGKIVYEIISFMIVTYACKKEVKIKWLVIAAVSFLVIYPGITMYRDILTNSASPYELTLNGIIRYYEEHNMFVILSHRFSYFDEVYYCLSLPKGMLQSYISNTGRIHELLLSGIIPRALWSNKPTVSQGLQITYYLMKYPVYKGASTITYIGDAFTSYGHIGIFIFTLFYASLVKRVQLKMKQSSVFVFARSIVYCTICLTFMEGSISGKIITFLFTMILFKVVSIITARKDARLSNGIGVHYEHSN